MRTAMLVITASLLLCLAACEEGVPSSDQIANQKQEQLSKQAVQEVGMPAIVNFQEKRVLKQILELRDTKIATVTYIVDWQAKLHKFCDSIGYGIPYATQYTNPQRAQHPYAGVWYTIPQADPNGLFSPAAAEGTWVLCLNPETKDVAPVYVEPRIVASPFALKAE
jgi:hypothetical protein